MFRTIGPLVLAVALMGAPPLAAQQTIEIPRAQIDALPTNPLEGVELDLSTPEGLLRAIEDIARIDWTDTLPEAVAEQILGASPVGAHRQVVWGMEVTGAWTENIGGGGTLTVLDQTALGAAGGRQFYAVLDTTDARDWPFHLFAFVPDAAPTVAWTRFIGPGDGHSGGGAGFSQLSNHMFDTDRLLGYATPEGMRTRGFSELTDDYLYTQVQGGRIRVDSGGNAYRLSFSAMVEEFHSEDSRPTGRVSMLHGWICEAAAHEADPESCLYDELRLVENTPAHQRENVNFDAPHITFTFSDPVEAASVADSFTLVTRRASGSMREIPGEVVALNERAFQFLPDDPLLAGVIFEASLEGGPNGVRARDSDEYLPEGVRWRFSTLVDHYRRGRVMDVHAYQTMRDAPLVMGKPALVRVYVDWAQHQVIHPDWRVTSYPAEIEANQDFARIAAQFGRPPEDGVIRIVHPDRFNEAHRRHALHTINLFGWVPEWSGARSELELSLIPHEPYPEEHPDATRELNREFDNWPVQPRRLRFHYAYLEMGSWADGVPLEERLHAIEVVRRAQILSTQLFPVLSTHGAPIRVGDVQVDIDEDFVDADVGGADRLLETIIWGFDDQNLYDGEPRSGHILRRSVTRLRNLMGVHAAPGDIITVFYPSEIAEWGMNYREAFSDYADRGVGMVIDSAVSVESLSMGLVHEFGHAFGLDHDPGDFGVYSYAPRHHFDRGMEGFRLTLSGTHGWNKSMAEGNAEAVALVPLMWPAVMPEEWIWLNQAAYGHVMRAFEGRAQRQDFGALPGGALAQYAAADGAGGGAPLRTATDAADGLGPLHAASADAGGGAETLVVMGTLHPEGAAGTIDYLIRAERDWSAPRGDFTAELLDAAGRILSATRFGPDTGAPSSHHHQEVRDAYAHADPDDPDDPAWWHEYAVGLAPHPDAVRLIVRHGDTLLAERAAPGAPPVLTASTDQLELRDDPAALRWTGQGAAPLRYDLRYSPTGAAPWQALLHRAEASQARIDPRVLTPGPAPTLRITAHDGFNEGAVDIPVTLHLPPAPVWTSPEGGAGGISAQFAVPLDPDSAAAHAVLRDTVGNAVLAQVRLSPVGDTLALLPETPLEPGAAYTARLLAGLSDAYGNRLEADYEWRFTTADTPARPIETEEPFP